MRVVLLVAALLLATGCCGPVHHCGQYQCPPRFCVPQPIYGEPMHPVLRRDGGTVLIPHGQFKGWVRDSPPVQTPVVE